MITLLKQIEMVKIKDFFAALQFVFALPVAFIVKKLILKQELWVICESEKEARDNGYWFFKYLRENTPDILVVYAIDKSSKDYSKVSSLGTVIQYGSFVHWICYLCASLNISTQKSGKPNAAVCYVLEVVLNFNKKCVFLQHGITKDDAEWLYYKNTKMRLFICGAKAEYEYVKKKFGYPQENVVYTGFARFDQLHNIKIVKNQILVMPTWREWIATPTSQSYQFDNVSDFKRTEFFQKWNQLLNSPELVALLEKYDCNLLFYPHQNMQKFLDDFQCSTSRINLVNSKEYDIQQALKESELLITDYSSVFMDFVYMKKPVLFYQFDYEKFRKGQYAEGYYDYKNGFGECYYKLSEIIKGIEDYCKEGFKMKELYKQKIEDFFVLNDTENCSRILKAVKNL